MRIQVLIGVLVISLLANLGLFGFVLLQGALRSSDQTRWNRQSLMVVEWCGKLEKEHRPISEAERFFGQPGERFIWGPRFDDVWTIQFEVDDQSKIVSASIDGYEVIEFAELYKDPGSKDR